MNIIENIIPEGKKNRPGKPNYSRYITIHNTGNTSKGANAISHGKFLLNTKDSVSWHYTVDDKNIVQHIPDNESAYHAGDGANGLGNRHSIGIEICVNSDGDLNKATDNAVKLVCHLMNKHVIPITNVVQHNHWSGKNCPSSIRAGKPYDWNTFINNVKENLYPNYFNKPEFENPTKGLTYWANKGVVNDFEYWFNMCKDTPWLGTLINNTANYSENN